MEGTDIQTGNIDPTVDYSHTYYGNGCPNIWTDNPNRDGSTVSCSTRITATYDKEDQKNGTYYHFQAATSGTGGSIKTENTISPDTFCPLGWQLPYGGTGGDYYDKSRSWNYLFNQYEILDGGVSGSAQARSYPISFVNGGQYVWYYGVVGTQGNSGYIWSNTGRTLATAYRASAVSVKNVVDNKTYGSAIRCVGIREIAGICRSKNLEHLCSLRTRRDDVERLKRGVT